MNESRQRTRGKMRRLPRSKSCFVCGGANSAGLDIQFHRDEAGVSCTWVPDEKHRGYRDRVHGGVIASILDEVMGWVPSSEYRRLCYSIELNVKYRRPVIVGHTYRVEGKIVEVKRRATRTEARVVDEAGTAYASATGVYVPMPEGETEKVLKYLHVDGEERGVTVADL